MRRPATRKSSGVAKSEYKVFSASTRGPGHQDARPTRRQFQALARTVARAKNGNLARGLATLGRDYERLTNANVNALARGINYKSTGNVGQAVAQAARWLKDRVGNEPYALIVMKDGEHYKSDEWLAPRVSRTIGRWPAAVVPVKEIRDVRATVRRLGVKTFVYLDDATYSGSQIEGILNTFRKHASPGWRLFAAAGFASKAARDLIAKFTDDRVAFYAPEGMADVGDFLKTLPNEHAKRRLIAFLRANNRYVDEINEWDSESQLVATPLTVLSHKVPNSVSFPVILGKGLERVLPRPPYKRYMLDPALRFGSTYEHEGGQYVSMKRPNDTQWTHMGFRHSRGQPKMDTWFTSPYPSKRALAHHTRK